ncbi:MAG TPA: amino acid adenylation domain-containing protein, partial [Candidatus Kapabacteria bacterium]|nr:amino acid adenylation domain-containing protein [Candidatus Kapabacteria bacterium]
FLAKVSNREVIIVGTPTAGRKHADLEHVIGMFVNTLALCNYPSGAKTFGNFFSEVQEQTLQAFENQDYQFEDLVEKVVKNRDQGRNPLFDVMFALQNFSNVHEEDEKVGSRHQDILHGEEISKFDLSLDAIERGEKLYFIFAYCTKLFRKETILRFIQYFKKIISSVIDNPGKKILELEIISAAEKQRLLFEFNQTATGYPKDKTIPQLFAEQAEKAPDQISLVGANRHLRVCPVFSVGHVRQVRLVQLTYLQLNEQSNRVAWLLVQKGVLADNIIGIKMERSIEMIIGMLAILKSGGAYLPIDPEYPQERIEYMLKDSGARILINKSEIRNPKFETNPNDQKINDPNKNRHFGTAFVLNLNHLNFEFVSNFDIRASDLLSSNLAYVIYTSGSTGRPKGVMIEHRNVARLVKNSNYIHFTSQDRLLPTGSPAFDITTFEIWGPLCNGAMLSLVSKDVILNAGKLKEVLVNHHITILHLIPQLFNQLASADSELFARLRCFLVGGDLVSSAYINALRKRYRHLKILHMYGPTENTTFSTYFPVEQDYELNIPIGTPVANSTAYVIDKCEHLQPISVMGELCVGGEGIARGYLNNPELTSEKFKHDLWDYRDNHDEKNKRLTGMVYKTGDVARWLPDGNIEFLGRIDQQTKIRGFRVELGEIENRLVDYPGLKEAVVSVLAENEDKYLCAYVVSEKEYDVVGLREFLLEKLPDYMVPSYFVRLEKMPLTPNGKVDRKALPKPGLKVGGSYAAPRDEIEKKLVELWAEILGSDTAIGIDDNFFQLGGHSLKATVLVSRIHKNFNVQVAFKEIFQNPTVRSLSTYLKDMSGNRYAAMEPVEEKEYYALSSGQKRLYILQQMELESTAYNMPQEFHLIGPDIEKLETIFKKLIERHESLRTSFQMINGEPVQRIYDHVEFEIEHAMNFVRPFDLAKAPLLRVGLSRETENEYMMMVDMHHIISDGVSQGILIADFFTLYNGDSLEPVRIQYKDFSQWQNSEKEKEKIKKQEAYWLNIFADEVPVLNIPTDYSRPAVQSFSGRSFGFELEPGMYVGLKNMAAAKGGTLYMVLLAIYNVLLAKLSNREDIVIGTTTAGRRHADLENTIGMFVNTLALRNYPEGHKDFEGFLVEVKERTLEAFENQEYPFEDLVEKVVLKRDVSRNPIFDTMFTLHQENRVETSQLDIKPYEIESGIAKFDLILTCTESEEKLSFSFDYGIKLFKEETIQRFTTYFKQVVSAIIENRNRQLSQVEIITPEEKKQLLYEFNDLTPRFPGEKNICRLFEEQVARTPDAVSLHYMSHITYFELNKKSELLAQRLIDEGVRPGLIVGLMAERSPEMIAGILGTWKTGCAYAPLNPKAPAIRNDYMLAECGAGFLLTNTEIRRLETHAHAQSTIDLAYVIFTSGSTGN